MFITDKFDQKNYNHFRLSARSGLVTGVAAAGVLFAWRWPALAPHTQWITGIHVRWRTVAGFTAAQEMALDLYPVRDFANANYTGGTDLSHPTTAANRAYVSRETPYGLDTTQRASQLTTGNVRIATTGALAHAGAPIIASHPLVWDSYSEMAAGATVPTGFLELFYTPPDGKAWGIGNDAGFIISPPVALGAGGTGRLFVGVDFAEG